MFQVKVRGNILGKVQGRLLNFFEPTRTLQSLLWTCVIRDSHTCNPSSRSRPSGTSPATRRTWFAICPAYNSTYICTLWRFNLEYGTGHETFTWHWPVLASYRKTCKSMRVLPDRMQPRRAQLGAITRPKHVSKGKIILIKPLIKQRSFRKILATINVTMCKV